MHDNFIKLHIYLDHIEGECSVQKPQFLLPFSQSYSPFLKKMKLFTSFVRSITLKLCMIISSNFINIKTTSRGSAVCKNRNSCFRFHRVIPPFFKNKIVHFICLEHNSQTMHDNFIKLFFNVPTSTATRDLKGQETDQCSQRDSNSRSKVERATD